MSSRFGASGAGTRKKSSRARDVLALCTGTTLALAIQLGRSSLALAAQAAPGDAREPVPVTLQLDYRREPAAKGCVSSEQLAREVEARLGRRVFAGAGEAEIVARVRARRVARRFLVELELFDRAGRSLGRRELSTRAAHCSSLDDSLALVLALAADMPRGPESRAPEGAPAGHGAASDDSAAPGSREPTPFSLSPSLGTPLSIPETTHAPRLGMRLRPSLGVAAAVGFVPSLSPGLELGLELRLREFWPIRADAAGFAEQRQVASVPSKGATFAAQTLSLGVCPWTHALGGFEGVLCAVQSLGRIRARGIGFDQEQRDAGWVLHAGAALSLSRELGPLFVTAAGSLLVPVVRRRYFFTDGVDITLYEQPWLGGLVALRVGTEI